MDLPAEVLVHNTILGMKGKDATLLQVHPEGFYELTCYFGDTPHRVYLPVRGTAIIATAREELAEAGEVDNLER
jgi:hypothetical protein